jgi:hypothetical protein
VAYHILKYISCEGRLSVFYAYHFRLLHQLRHLSHQKLKEILIIPYFLLQSLKEMSTKVKGGKKEALAHHGLIKLIVYEALGNLKHKVSWEYFVDMERKAFLEAQEAMKEQIPKEKE